MIYSPLYFRYFYHKNNDINTEKKKWVLLVKVLNHFFQKVLKWFVRETCKSVEKLTGRHLYSSQWSFMGDIIAQKNKMLLGVQSGEWVWGSQEGTGLEGT